MKNFLSLNLKALNNRILKDETLKLELTFSLKGDIRESFSQRNWEEAWDKHDIIMRFFYKIKIYREEFLRKLLGEFEFIRKAKFYWSRNPDLPYRIWVMIVDEEGNPILPKDEMEAKEFLFDGVKSFNFFGKEIGLGKHRLAAEVNVKWLKHTFTDKNSLKVKSNFVEVEII
ncbi:hypothetical protein HRbin06_00256 [archaeon HR06]|nr:hypothetical protein HRbin06_00256 [archaeon HR06]